MADFYGGGGGGGGYDSTSGGYDSNASPSNGSPSGDRKAVDRNEQNLVPVTIKQIHDAQEIGDSLHINGRVANQVKIIAAIQDVSENSTSLTFTLEDGTGTVSAKMWVDEAENDNQAMERAKWTQGKYVTVIGQLRTHQGQRNLTAYNVQVVTDFNAVTYHFLNAMHVSAVMNANARGSGVKAEVGGMSGLVHAAAPRQDGSDLLAQQADMMDGDTPIQRDILKLFKAETSNMDDTGLDIKIIIQKMVGKFKADDVKTAIAQLSEEGHIYSTVDDDHYMVT